MYSSDELLLKLRKHEIKKIEIPEWQENEGEPVPFLYIRSLSGSQREEVEEILIKNKTKDLRSLIFVMSVCDEKGSLLYTREDMRAINEGNSKVLDLVLHASVKLNKMSEEDRAEAKKN